MGSNRIDEGSFFQVKVLSTTIEFGLFILGGYSTLNSINTIEFGIRVFRQYYTTNSILKAQTKRLKAKSKLKVPKPTQYQKDKTFELTIAS